MMADAVGGERMMARPRITSRKMRTLAALALVAVFVLIASRVIAKITDDLFLIIGGLIVAATLVMVSAAVAALHQIERDAGEEF
jgi:hypothetical protein